MFLYNRHKVGLSLLKYICYLTRDSVSLNQKSYLKRVLLQFEIDICKPASLPIDLGVPNCMLPASKNH